VRINKTPYIISLNTHEHYSSPLKRVGAS